MIRAGIQIQSLFKLVMAALMLLNLGLVTQRIVSLAISTIPNVFKLSLLLAIMELSLLQIVVGPKVSNGRDQTANLWINKTITI